MYISGEAAIHASGSTQSPCCVAVSLGVLSGPTSPCGTYPALSPHPAAVQTLGCHQTFPRPTFAVSCGPPGYLFIGPPCSLHRPNVPPFGQAAPASFTSRRVSWSLRHQQVLTLCRRIMWASIEIFIGPTVAASGKRWIAGMNDWAVKIKAPNQWKDRSSVRDKA